MKRFLLALISVGLAAVQVRAVENVEMCRMENAIRSIESDSELLRLRIREYLRDKQIVFVSGYKGCFSREFRDSRLMVQAIDRGVPIGQICPPSDNAIETNVGYIIQQLDVIASSNPDRRIILVGHSKGGAEIFQAVATHPELFMPDKTRGWQVASVVTIAATFGGSIIADLVLERDADLNEKWRRFEERNGGVGHFMKWLTSWFADYQAPGFLSLSRPISVIRSRHILANISEETKEILRKKVFFVTSQRDAEENDMPFFLISAARFLREMHIPNDGLVIENDQRLPEEVGAHLLRVNRAGHFSLIDASYGEPECRQEFTRLLLLNLAMTERRR